MDQETVFSEDGLTLSTTLEDGKTVAFLGIEAGESKITKRIEGEVLDRFQESLSRIQYLIQHTVDEDMDDDEIDLDFPLVAFKTSISSISNIEFKYLRALGNLESEPTAADVFIGLPQEEIDIFTIERIQNATGDFMEALGFELETQDEPVFGSFFQRLKYLLKGEVKQEVGELYSKGKTALEVQFVSVPSAEATGKLATAAASLITALSGIDEASIRLGAILVVKVSRDGVPLILAETVSPELALLLDKNPQLLKNPNVVFDLISTMQTPVKTIEESGSAEVVE